MEHDEAVRLLMTEQYLLDELSPEQREEFEEHYFDCRECAADVSAAVAFADHSKAVFAAQPADEREPSWFERPWLAWLRPALVPAFALLLVAVGYDDVVTHRGGTQPRVVAVATINLDTYAGNETVTVPPGGGLVLLVRIPPDSYSGHTVELQNPSGKSEGSVALPAVDGRDLWPVEFPARARPAGAYTLVVRGSGDGKEVSRKAFDLQIQK